MLVNRAALNQNIRPKRGKAGSAIDDDEFRRLQATFNEIIEQRPSGGFAFAPMFLTDRRTFWPSCLTPRAIRSEIEVDFLSSLSLLAPGVILPSQP